MGGAGRGRGEERIWGDAPAGGRAAHAARDLRDHILVEPLLDAYAQRPAPYSTFTWNHRSLVCVYTTLHYSTVRSLGIIVHLFMFTLSYSTFSSDMIYCSLISIICLSNSNEIYCIFIFNKINSFISKISDS